MGRRKEPITREGFGCPCKLNEKDDIFADCRLFLSGQHILPGETKQGGIRFSFDPAAPLFRAAGIFYLWGGRIIGKAIAATVEAEAQVHRTSLRHIT